MQTESLKIFHIISQIEHALEASPRPKMSSGNKRTVDIDLLFDLLGDLKVTIPEDIRRANSVLIDANSLLASANEEGDELVNKAQMEAASIHEQALAASQEIHEAAEAEYQRRVSEHEVLLEAQRRAELLQQLAEQNANVVFDGAKQYADELLEDVQRYLMQYHAMVSNNRAELGINARQAPQQAPLQPQPVQKHPTQQQRLPNAAPTAPQYASDEEEEEEEQPRRRWSLFSRKPREEEYFDDDDDDDFEEEAEQRRRGFRRKNEELDDGMDVDLDE